MAVMLNLFIGAVVVGATLITWRTIMAALEDLSREVSEVKTAADSAITLIEGLKARLDDAIASGDMAQVQTLADSLSESTDRLAAAVLANTPAQVPLDENGNPLDGGPVEGATFDEQGNPIP